MSERSLQTVSNKVALSPPAPSHNEVMERDGPNAPIERPSRAGRMMQRLGLLGEYDPFRVPDPTWATHGIFDPNFERPTFIGRTLERLGIIEAHNPSELKTIPLGPTVADLEDRAITRAASRADPRWQDDPPPLYMTDQERIRVLEQYGGSGESP